LNKADHNNNFRKNSWPTVTIYYLYYVIIICDLWTSKIVLGLASASRFWPRPWPRENVLV